MKLKLLRQSLLIPIFSTAQVQRLFPHESLTSINIQLKRLVDKQEVARLKKGLFMMTGTQIDEFVIANYLYPQSYISLESALNSNGILPDVTAQVTSVTPLTSKLINSPYGSFLYSKINSQLYFGFTQIQDHHSQLFYRIAEPEKAILDYIYIRKIKDIAEHRLDLSQINRTHLVKLSKFFPKWVQKVVL